MERPSEMASTMELKLSSANTMSDASFATAVPVIPIAMPMSASLSAGASLTPSPVMATTWPFSLSSRTMSCLCLGSARLNTHPPGAMTSAVCCSRDMAPNSRPVKDLPSASAGEAKMPMSEQMASAVNLLSPVMTMTRMPAVAHASMAPRTSGRGGSRRPARPTNVKSDSMPAYSAESMSCLCAGCVSEPSYARRSWRPAPDLTAKPRQRSADLDISATLAVTSARMASESATTVPSGSSTCAHRSNTHSGAPLTRSLLVSAGRVRSGVLARVARFTVPPASGAAPDSCSLTITLMLLRPRSNSRVASFTHSAATAAETAWHPLAGSATRRSAMRDMSASDGTPIFSASTLRAPSVGSPAHLYCPSLSSITASLHMTHTCATLVMHTSCLSLSLVSPTMSPSAGA
mmetsp:Transcript_7535/g.11806  ORF Transcript_7535/g.11806 Transcript_7535/m.11806 type:complete len:405 (-) Transcript_7535:11-1225(-)